MKTFLWIALTALLLGCQKQKQMDENQGRAELKRLRAVAVKSNAVGAVQAGEEALNLIGKVNFQTPPSPKKREVAAQQRPLDPAAVNDLRTAEDLATAGEQAFVFEAFDESLRIFQIAFQKDPRNEKANAYLALLTPVQYLKGLEWRQRHSEDEEDIAREIMEILAKPEIERNMRDHYKIFARTPYKERFTDRQQMVDEVIKPMTQAMIRALPNWKMLSDNRDLDIDLNLPNVHPESILGRMRSEDALMAHTTYLGYAIYLRMQTMYQTTGLLNYRRKNLENLETTMEMWNYVLKNPAFGILTDTDFIPLIQNQIIDFTKGMDIALLLFKRRELNKQNSKYDFFQFTPDQIVSCGPVKPRNSTYEGFIYIHRPNCEEPKVFTTPSILNGSLISNHIDESSELAPNSTEKEKREYYGNWWEERMTHTLTYKNLEADMNLLRRLMSGPEQVNYYCKKNLKDLPTQKQTWINFPAFFNNPITDLKTLGIQFADDGRILSSDDPTFHGLFPQNYPCMNGEYTQGLSTAILVEPTEWVNEEK